MRTNRRHVSRYGPPTGRTFTLALMGSLLSLSPLAAQVRPVPERDTVRVWAPDYGLNKTKATVLGWADSVAQFSPLMMPADTVRIPFRSVTRLDHFRGRNTSLGVLRGASIGASAGMLFGLLIGNAAVAGCHGWFCELEALNYMAGGTLIGAGVGGAIGAALPPDRWARVDLPVSAGFPPHRRPVHETLAFRILSVGAGLLLTALVSGS